MNKEKVRMYSEQVRGVSYKESDIHDFLNGQSVTLLRANNIFDNELNFDNVVYIDKSRVSDKQYLRKGDIVVCASSGSKNLVGKAAQVDFDTEVTFGAFLKVVRPKNIIPKYLGYYFLSNEYRRTISSISEGANINNIRNEHIDDLLISIVDNDTQKMRSKILDKVYGILKRKKQQLTEYDQLIKSRFVEMFGNEENKVSLENVCLGITDGSHNPPKGIEYSEYVMLSSKNINDRKISLEDPRYLALEDFQNENRRTQIQAGDVLLTIVGTIGRTAVVPDNFKNITLQRSVAVLHPNLTIVTPTFLEQSLSSIQHVIEAEANGVAQKGIYLNQVRKLQIKLAKLEKQIEYTKFVQQVDKLKSAVQKSLEETQILFDSLMQKYFG